MSTLVDTLLSLDAMAGVTRLTGVEAGATVVEAVPLGYASTRTGITTNCRLLPSLKRTGRKGSHRAGKLPDIIGDLPQIGVVALDLFGDEGPASAFQLEKTTLILLRRLDRQLSLPILDEALPGEEAVGGNKDRSDHRQLDGVARVQVPPVAVLVELGTRPWPPPSARREKTRARRIWPAMN
jgi:hypothetical protein